MLSKIVAILKPIFGAVLILLILNGTGLMSSISATTQSAVLKTGLMDADGDVDAKGDDFDYGFVVNDMAGNKVSMEQFKGKVIFLNLWATWCGPCRAEMPTIQKLYDAVPKEDIAFVMLSVDYDQDVIKIAPFIKNKAYSFPVYHQPMKSLSKQLQLPSIPATLVISKSGKIIAKEIGMTNFNTPEFKSLLETEAKK